MKTFSHQIIPCPVVARRLPGNFRLTRETVIVTDMWSKNSAQQLAELLRKATGFKIPIQTEATTGAPWISLVTDSTINELGAEGYSFEVLRDHIEIEAVGDAGLFYASQTLRQLLPKEALAGKALRGARWIIPCISIQDKPRFQWRGLMLDVARQFFPVPLIKRCIDLMAFYKMNRLHLHLTDGQAWTLQLESYPEITAGVIPQSKPSSRGVYSVDDIRDIVSYAAKRQVMVIPEIEFPCHSDAVLSIHPELMCVNNPARTGGEGHREYCPGRNDMFTFSGKVLSEVAKLFPSPYIHIGGDEYFGTSWENCPDCRKRMQDQKLESEDSEELKGLFKGCQGSPRKYLLYRYMMRRIAAQVVELGKLPVLWDDLSWRGQFPEKSVILKWHYKGLLDWMQQAKTPEDPAVDAAIHGHSAIVAPASHLYFDYFDGGKALERLYNFEPMPSELHPGKAEHVLGPHACLWEQPLSRVDEMLFPRTLALAEMGWTEAGRRSWPGFVKRLAAHLGKLAKLGVKCAKITNPIRLGEERVVGEWNVPRLTSGLKEWFVNDAILDNQRYELRIKMKKGLDTVVTAFWVEDGYEQALGKPARASLTEHVYRLKRMKYDQSKLYTIRLYLKGQGKKDSKGKVCIKRLDLAKAPARK